MKENNRWKEAQKSEIDCWDNIKKKIVSEEYLKKKIIFWEKMFKKINLKCDINKKKSFLDFGCGPNGIVLVFQKKKNLVCLDPLMKEYLRINPKLKKFKAKYVSSKIEEFSTSEKFNYIFGFNSLDHVDSIKDTLKKIKSLLDKNGRFMISINCHNFKFMQKILLKTSFIFDSPHPHQYTLNDYVLFLEKNGFKVIDKINLDDEVYFMSYEEKNGFSLKSFLYKITRPCIILNILGIPRYGKSKQKTIYSTYVIIAKK
jgi:2-polyprenyl-3-methyl-5-hydroxy-6-metoxy-1,4-benzoquinol methylase